MVDLRHGAYASAVVRMHTQTDTYQVYLSEDIGNGEYHCDKDSSHRPSVYDSKTDKLDGEPVLGKRLEAITIRVHKTTQVDRIKEVVHGSMFEPFFSAITHGSKSKYGFMYDRHDALVDVVPNTFRLSVLFPDAILPYVYQMYEITEDEIIMMKIHNMDVNSLFEIKNVRVPFWKKIFRLK